MRKEISRLLDHDWEAIIAELQRMGEQPVTVAVLDSGIDGSHPDLARKISQSFAVNVSAADPDQADVVSLSTDQNNDLFGHGTAVASIIAAVCPAARIIDVRVLQSNNTGGIAALLRGAELAVDDLASPVVNMSLAAQASARFPLFMLCERAYYQNQIVVAARRNLPFGDDGLPAEMSAAIGVDRYAAERFEGIRFVEESRIEFAAHGENVTAAAPGGLRTTVTGSSFAAPVVSGICALLKAADPAITPYEMKAFLKNAGRTER